MLKGSLPRFPKSSSRIPCSILDHLLGISTCICFCVSQRNYVQNIPPYAQFYCSPSTPPFGSEDSEALCGKGNQYLLDTLEKPGFVSKSGKQSICNYLELFKVVSYLLLHLSSGCILLSLFYRRRN